MKINILIQAALGNEKINDWSLNNEIGRVRKTKTNKQYKSKQTKQTKQTRQNETTYISRFFILVFES
jgi:hypothetical protein